MGGVSIGPTKNPNKKSDPEPHSSRLYRELAPAYRVVWPAVARRRIVENVRTLDIPPGARVLEVGVGTGISLDCYPAHATVTGVDLSDDMLDEARERIRESGWDHCSVEAMNAESLTFDDSSFDIVTSFHTISVVADPREMMREMVRVCRPGGTLLLINHFRSDNRLIARFVDSAGNLTKRLGWRTDLDLDEILAEFPIRIDDRHKSSPLSLFTVLKATVDGDKESRLS